MNKAIIKLEDYIAYLKSDKFNISEFHDEFSKTFHGKWNEPEVKIISNAYEKIFGSSYLPKNISFRIFDDITFINDYIVNNNFMWNIIAHIGRYITVSYGKSSLFIIDEFVDIIEAPDYSNYSVNQVKQLFFNSDNIVNTKLPSEINNLSINDINNSQNKVISEMDNLKSEIESVKQGKHNELAKLQQEIDEKLALMNSKKEALMAELNEKMLEFNKKLAELKKQIFMLKTNIYSIRCLAGETVELIQLREGKDTDIDAPIVLNQKILYLDEDLAKTVSIYGDAINKNYKLLEEALKYNDIVMEMFCPQPKSISFFKCSKKSQLYFHDTDDDILASYDMLHGKKIGFVVRNGENLYVGWLEEEWDYDKTDKDEHILTFNDSVIYKPTTVEVSESDVIDTVQTTSIDHIVSRMFAISVLQGLIEHKRILELPELVNISVPSKYVIHNYADGWIEDKRYGDFATLVNNLHQYNHVNDIILLVRRMKESNQNNYSGNRSRGELNTTRDCIVDSGLNKINLIENGNVYISAKKEDWGWIERKNNANFEIDKDEFINLTFMNSDWLYYFINTKNIGSFGSYRRANGSYDSYDYSYLIKYFKMAYEYLLEREKEEYTYIQNELGEISLNDFDWKDLLSHWKIKNNVRIINEYQAKRFARYLIEGNYYKIAHLYESEFKVPKSLDSITDYFVTLVSSTSSRHSKYCCKNTEYPKYSWTSNEYIDTKYYFDNNTPLETIKEREMFDREKLKVIRNSVFKYASDNNVDILNDKYFNKLFKKLNGGWISEYNLNKTSEFIINKILTDEIDFESCKDIFTNEIQKSDYYYVRSLDEKLYELTYLVLLQIYVYPHIIWCIQQTIIHNYYNEITKIQ